MANAARLTVKGIDGVVEIDFDVAAWRGDVLETLEEHLGDTSVFVWARRWADGLGAGARLSEFRVRDMIALVYLGRAQADPDTTWESVSRAISPFTIAFLPDEPDPAPAVSRRDAVGVDPDLGRHVPAPPTGWTPPFDPGAPAETPAPAPARPEDYYRQP